MISIDLDKKELVPPLVGVFLSLDMERNGRASIFGKSSDLFVCKYNSNVYHSSDIGRVPLLSKYTQLEFKKDIKNVEVDIEKELKTPFLLYGCRDDEYYDVPEISVQFPDRDYWWFGLYLFEEIEAEGCSDTLNECLRKAALVIAAFREGCHYVGKNLDYWKEVIQIRKEIAQEVLAYEL